MSTWYYFDEKGDKIQVTGGQLKGLAKAGRITPETVVETEEGKTAPARKVKGLTFGEATQPEKPPAPSPAPSLPSASPNPFTAIPPVSASPFTAAPPSVNQNQTIQQSDPAPVAGTGTGSSWQVTLIGIVLIAVVGGIGWAIIEGTSPSNSTSPSPLPKQATSEKGNKTITESPVNKPPQKQFQVTDAELAGFTEEEKVEIKDFFASVGSDVSTLIRNGSLLCSTAFIERYATGAGAVTKFLIFKTEDVNVRDEKHGVTALHGVAFHGNVELAKLLVSKGANVNAKSIEGLTPLDMANGAKKTAMVQYLTNVGGTDKISDRVQQVLKQFDSSEGARMREKVDFCITNGGYQTRNKFSEKEKDGVIKYLLLAENALGIQYSSERIIYLLRELAIEGNNLRGKIDAYIACGGDIRTSRFYLNDTFSNRHGYIRDGDYLRYNSATDQDKNEVNIIRSLLPEANRLSGNAHDAKENKKIEDAERAKKQEEERRRLFGN
jgi:hypothetical protein